jgi:hypothetical protein
MSRSGFYFQFFQAILEMLELIILQDCLTNEEAFIPAGQKVTLETSCFVPVKSTFF